MPDIFDEVEEDLRAERMKRLLARYGGLLTGFMLLVVGGVAGWQGWRWYEDRGAAAAAGAFLAAADAASAEGADLKAAADRFAGVSAEAPPGYRILARLREAALRAEAGDGPGAVALYDRIATDAAVEPMYRELATTLWALHALDTGDAGMIEARLAPLAAGPWRATVQEIRALAAVKRGATEEARRSLTALVSDAQAPQALRERASRLLAGLGG